MFRPTLILCLLASPAVADVDFFSTPSGNIHCSVGIEANVSDIFCTIYERTPTLPRPGNCRSAGHTVSMLNRGPVTLECDQPGKSYARPSDPGSQVLQYGQRWDIGGILCSSSRQGLECRNDSGHGFFLSRARQSVF
ncbi:hypothetical protein Q4543_07450 [Salipiger sp. 1_MG-2023]|uniref:DUF6636 domain-containing protein n=1 Tax=Salipiger sp. 1_MG-2023 TaxID=3062665 RepID=UPI0026E1E935|nr:DUF6636 domain-containing protein [Salipiger sp. 1_MG-2023]MDO6585349.1 hypothetical protein [Salipiger sp. 1_MG-2023]